MQGGNWLDENFSMWESPCGNYPAGDFLGGNFLGGSFPGWELSGWELAGGEFAGWEFSWVRIAQVGLILGGNFLCWKFSKWELSGGNHPGGNFLSRSFHVTKTQTIRIQIQNQRVYFTANKCCCQLNSYFLFLLTLYDFDFSKLL